MVAEREAVIGGDVWEECGEPMWAIRWQGATAFAYARIPEKEERPYGFNALQKDLVSIPDRFEAVSFYDEIEVRIPEAVRRDPMREKLEKDAEEAAAREARASRELKEAREANRQAQSALAEYLDMTADAPWCSKGDGEKNPVEALTEAARSVEGRLPNTLRMLQDA